MPTKNTDKPTPRIPISNAGGMGEVCALSSIPTRRVHGESVDAGFVFSDSGDHLQHEFTVTNTSGRAVRVLGVEKTCTCTSAEISRDFLQPGESACLRASVRIPGVRNRVSVSCTLNTDHPTLREWVYSLAFECLPHIALSHTYVDMGSSEKGVFVPKTQRVVAEVFGRSSADLPRVKFTAPEDLIVELDGNPKRTRMAENAWAESCTLILRLSDKHEKAPGAHAESVQVSTPDGRSASLNAFWRYEYPIVVRPAYVHFGRVKAGGRSGSKMLSLSSPLGRAFTVEKVGCKDAVASCQASFDSERTSSKVIDLTLTVSPVAQTGPMTGTVKVETDERLQRTVEVPWSVLVDPAGDTISQVDARTSGAINPKRGVP